MPDTAALKKHLWQEIERHQDDLVALLMDLLRFNTENPPGNSAPISGYIGEFLGRTKIAAEDAVAPGGHHNVLWNLPCSQGGRRLLFCGHSDVVPAGDPARWEFPPFSGDLVDGYVRGRGASDMKGGVAGILFVARLLADVREDLAGSLGLAIVDDEEAGGQFGARWVLEQGLVEGDGCIIAEPSGPMSPTIGQKGSCWFEVTFTGSPAHGSLAPLAGDNAIVKAAAAVQHLQKLHQMLVTIPPDIAETVAISKAWLAETRESGLGEILDHVSINVGIIRGGTKTNIVPDACTIEVDSRVPFGLTHHDVMAYVRRLLDELGYRYEVRPLGFQGSANYTVPGDPVVQALLAGIRDVHGGSPVGVLQWASSDARHFRMHGIPVLQYGPAELSTIHSFNERVKAADVVACAKVYAAAAVNYLSLGRGTRD